MKISKLFLTAAIAMAANAAQASTVANWKQLNPDATSTNSDMDTNSPTIGDGTTTDDADNTWVAGRFGTVGTPESVTLAIGETLTVSGSVTLTGGKTISSNLRFGVFDESGQFASGGTTWANGGWLLRDGGGTSDVWYQAATDAAFISTGGNAVPLTTTTTNTGGGFSGDSTAAYDWSISITRASATTVDLFGSIVGGDNGYNKTYTSNDITTSLFTYNALGVLLGDSLDLDQASFSNVQYSVIPEPSSAVVTSITKSGSTVTVEFEGVDGQTYDLNKSTDLDFSVLDSKDTVTLTDTTTGTLQDTTASEDAAFYRVEQQ